MMDSLELLIETKRGQEHRPYTRGIVFRVDFNGESCTITLPYYFLTKDVGFKILLLILETFLVTRYCTGYGLD